MSTTSERAPFEEVQFLEDLEKGSEELEAPYSESVVKSIVSAFGESIHDSALQLRAGSNPGVPLLFRILFALPTDALDVSLKQGWLIEGNPMVELHRGLKVLCPKAIDQPEFTIDKGCDSVFIYLGELYSVDHILSSPTIPDCIRANKPKFEELGLKNIVVTHLDYQKHTIGLYFLAQGPLTKKDLTEAVALAGVPEPSDDVYNDIVGVLLRSPYYLTAVMDYHSGRIVRIEYHLLFPVKLPDDMNIPDVGERLTTFWDIPSHEYEDMDILSYCFGDTEVGNIIALRSYCGGLRSLMRTWNIVGA